jgi:nucleoside phosphorylase
MQATRLLLAAAELQWLVSFGIAGGAREDLQIGDVVIAGNTCALEKGITSPFLSLAGLSGAAHQAASAALQPRGAKLVTGTAVTTRGSQWIQPGQAELPNPVLEMETWGIAQVAAQGGLPLLSLRAISDGPLASIPIDLEQIYDDEYNLRVGRLVKVAIRQPGLLLQTRSMMRNIRIAADNAAIALQAILGVPLPVISA